MDYCEDVVCVANAVCVDAYPAECVCVDDYILVNGTCSKENTFRINGMHIQTEFVDAYRDETSVEFLELSRQVRKTLLKTIREAEEESVIVNIKVFNPRPGSVIVDTIIATNNRSTHVEAFEEVKRAILSVNNTASEYIRIKKEYVPTIAIVEEEKNFAVIAVIVPLALLITCAMIALQCYRQKKVKAKNEQVMGERGIDNKTLQMEGVNQTSN